MRVRTRGVEMALRKWLGPVLGGALAAVSLSGVHGDVSGPTKARVGTHKATTATKRRAPRRPAMPGPLRGQLQQGDGVLQSGEFVDRHTITLPPGQAVRIVLTSRALDPYLIVRSPSGQQTDNDDIDGSTRDAAVIIPAAEQGSYTILVTSYQRGESGAYQLSFEPYSGARPGQYPGSPQVAVGSGRPPIGAPAAPLPVAGAGENGALGPGDRQLQSGEYYDQLTRTFTPGSSVRIRLESTAIDPYLIVRTPSGRQLDNDDTTPQDRNATVEIPAAEQGTYTILVTSYRPGEQGPYTLSFGGGAPVARPPVATTTQVQPNGATTQVQPNGTPASGGRVYGIFAGISDYPGSGDLPQCAEDAIKLAQALRRTGLQTEAQQVVLTDGQATVANIRDAMARMARQLGPNDVFVFFYSGHGSQRSGSRDPRELDGVDETLHVYDGDIVDDELGQLMDGIRANLSVTALDSCFSGGFSKDVITRAGRVGFFSSQEDVESAVATQFQAGGYLSYFLREGAGGEADTNPRDQVLTVGELEHYLVLQFGQNARDIAMDGAFQHLVTDRGAVRAQQVLWSYR